MLSLKTFLNLFSLCCYLTLLNSLYVLHFPVFAEATWRDKMLFSISNIPGYQHLPGLGGIFQDCDCLHMVAGMICHTQLSWTSGLLELEHSECPIIWTGKSTRAQRQSFISFYYSSSVDTTIAHWASTKDQEIIV